MAITRIWSNPIMSCVGGKVYSDLPRR